MARSLQRVAAEEDGQDLIEYALIAAFVSLICYGLVIGTGAAVSSMWDGLRSKVADAVAQL